MLLRTAAFCFLVIVVSNLCGQTQLATLYTEAEYQCFKKDRAAAQEFVLDYTSFKNKLVEELMKEHEKELPNPFWIKERVSGLASLEQRIDSCTFLKEIFFDRKLGWNASFATTYSRFFAAKFSDLLTNGSIESLRQAHRIQQLAKQLGFSTAQLQLPREENYLEKFFWTSSSTVDVTPLHPWIEEHYLVDLTDRGTHTTFETYAQFVWDTTVTKERFNIDLNNQLIGNIDLGDTTYGIYDDIAAKFILHTGHLETRGTLNIEFKNCPNCRKRSQQRTVYFSHDVQWITDFEGDENILNQHYPGIKSYPKYPSKSELLRTFNQEVNKEIQRFLEDYLHTRKLHRKFQDSDFK